MKTSPLKGPVFSISAYFKDVLARKLSRRVIKPPTTVQEPSTEATLARAPKDDESHFNRPWVDAMVYKDGEVFVNERSVSAQEVLLQHSLRQRGHFNTIGQPNLSGSSPETKANAIIAFMEAGSIVVTDYQKSLITRYFVAMQYPDTAVTKDVTETINEFMQLMKDSGLLEKLNV